MSMGFSCSMEQICSICGHSSGEHSPNCIVAMLDKLEEKQLYICCPKCERHSVGVNRSDYYECRNCGAQFSVGSWRAKPGMEKFFLDVPGKEDLTLCVILEEKGDGDFPLDKRIADLRKKIEEAQEAQ